MASTFFHLAWTVEFLVFSVYSRRSLGDLNFFQAVFLQVFLGFNIYIALVYSRLLVSEQFLGDSFVSRTISVMFVLAEQILGLIWILEISYSF